MIYTPGLLERKLLTTKDKTAKDFEALREVFDAVSGYDRGPDELKRMHVLLGLINGDVDTKFYEDPICFEVKNEHNKYEEIKFDYQNISHTPLIASNSNTYLGELSKKKFDPQIEDFRPNRHSIIKQNLERPVMQYFQRLVQVTQSQIMQKIAQNVDPRQLQSDPQIMQQVQEQAMREVQKQLPPTVLQFVNGEYSDPTKRQAQKMIDVLKTLHDLKMKIIEAKKYTMAFDETIYFAGDWVGRLEFRAENNINIVYGCGVKSDEWIQHSDWVRRRDHMSFIQLMSLLSPVLESKELKELEEDFTGFMSSHTTGSTPKYWGDNARTKELMYKYSIQDQEFKEYYGSADIKTVEGQEKFKEMEGVLLGSGNGDLGYCGIQVDHVCVRLPRKMIQVKTRDPKSGKISIEEYADHYTPTHNDIDVTELRRDQIWEAWGIGSFFEKKWVGIRPLPCQYQNPHNYDRPDMPYYGRKYSSNQNTTRSKSMVARAASAQKMFDTVLAKVKMLMATDTGNVFLMFMNLKPKNWKYQEWLDFTRNAGIMLMDPKSRQMNGVDPQFLKQINMSRMGEIAAYLQLLDYWKSMVAMSMFFDESQGAAFGQYMNRENVEQSQQRVYNKSAYADEQFRMTTEKALAGFLNRSRHYYKNNLREAAVFLDDVELKHLEMTPLSYFEWFGLTLKNSEEMDQKLKNIQNYLLSNNQSGRSDEASMRILCAENDVEVFDILKQETKRIEQSQQVQFERQQSLQNDKLQADAMEKQQERIFKLEEQARDLASKERRTAVDSQKYRLANDVDMDQHNDFLQGKLEELKFKYEELEAKKQSDEAERELKRELKLNLGR